MHMWKVLRLDSEGTWYPDTFDNKESAMKGLERELTKDFIRVEILDITVPDDEEVDADA